MTARLDAVLPLTAADAARAQILFRSLDRFFEPLGTLWVVAPDDDLRSLRRIVPTRATLLADNDVVPELGPSRPHGWFVQQLVKLAICDRVETPFYLTLDADVICVRPTRHDDLVRGGRAIAQVTKPHHPEWNDDAERVLDLPRCPHQHGVTPAVLSRAGALGLASYLGHAWRARLLRELPWTEYALYHTFLEGVGTWDELHVRGRRNAIYGNCVWIESQWPSWHPHAGGAYCFSVVQSATRVAPKAVWQRVAPFLGSMRTAA
jgi:hypothetical protein